MASTTAPAAAGQAAGRFAGFLVHSAPPRLERRPVGRHAAGSLSGTCPVIVQAIPWMRRSDASLVQVSLARYGGPTVTYGPTSPHGGRRPEGCPVTEQEDWGDMDEAEEEGAVPASWRRPGRREVASTAR